MQSGNEFANNIVVLAGKKENVYVLDSKGWRFDHNNWSVTPPAHVSGVGDIVGDPQFVAPKYTSPDGYELSFSSPLRGAGRRMEDITLDFRGFARANALDIGAFQFIKRNPARAPYHRLRRATGQAK